MSFMLELYYLGPADPAREAGLQGLVENLGGHLDYREVPADGGPGEICLTFDFEDRSRAEAAAECLRRQGEHIEGPVDYGPPGPSNGAAAKTAEYPIGMASGTDGSVS